MGDFDIGERAIGDLEEVGEVARVLGDILPIIFNLLVWSSPCIGEFILGLMDDVGEMDKFPDIRIFLPPLDPPPLPLRNEGYSICNL